MNRLFRFESGFLMFTKKDLSMLIIPLVIEQFLAVAIGMADTVMVASVGEAAVSGISLVDTINILLINIFAALATGGAIVVSQYFGREDPINAGIAAKQLLIVTAGISSVLCVLALLGNSSILSFIFGKIDVGVMENCKIYFFWSALSYPFIAVYNAGAALFRASGNSKISMFTSILMNLVNVGGNAILIFGFHMGVAGAAIATLVSRILGACVITLLLSSHNSKIHVSSFKKLDFHPAMVKNILRIGIPNGLENGMFQIGKILVQGVIASLGTAAIAANAVANSIANIPLIPGMAIGLAMMTVVGQCVGAGDYKQAKSYILKLTGIAYAALSVLSIFLFFAAPMIVGFFNLMPDTTVIAVELLRFHSICCILLWPASFTMPNGLRAAGDVKFTMVVSVFSMWAFRIGLSYVFAITMQMGVLGVWVAMAVDWAFRVICFSSRLCGDKWKKHRML